MVTENDAERVADGIGEDPEAGLPLATDSGRTQGQQFTLGLVGIAHPNVEMQLLGVGRVRPARRNPVRRPLKASCRSPGSRQMTTQPSMSWLILIPSTWQ